MVNEQTEGQTNAEPYKIVVILKDYYQSGIADSMDYMRFVGEENKVFQGLREDWQHNQNIVDLCREALFENAKLIKNIRHRIENDREAIKAIGRI